MQCTKLKTYMETGRVVFLPPSRIIPNPAQPRTVFSPDALQELADSIRIHGILQPLSVRKGETHYELIAGERRYRAAQLAGLKEIPCIVMRMNDTESSLAALLENLQRQDLNFVEEAKAYSRLMTRFSLSQEQVAKAVGKSQSAVCNTLRLLRHSEAVLTKLLEHNLTQRHGRALLKLDSEPQKLSAISHIARNSLSVSQTEQYIDSLLKPSQSRSARQLPQRATSLGAAGGRKSPGAVCAAVGKTQARFDGRSDCRVPQAESVTSPSGGGGAANAVTERVFPQILRLLQASGIPYTQEETPTHITLTLQIPL